MTSGLKRPIAGGLACVGALILLVLLAFRVERLQRLDATVLRHFAAQGESSLGALAGFIVRFADPLPLLTMLAVVVLMALRWGRPRYAIAAVVLVGGANLTTQILKAALAHPRYQPILGWHQVGSTAFPSGHATAAMSIVLAFELVVPREWRPTTIPLGVCLVFAVCCSVLVLHLHYPSDVIGGLLVATGWFCAAVAGLGLAESKQGALRRQR